MSSEFSPEAVREYLLEGWRPQRVGGRLEVVAETDSTNRYALACSGEAAADGLFVLADHQTAGRGRQGRSWLSPRGASVLCTALVICEEPRVLPESGIQVEEAAPEQSLGGLLTLVAAVAGCEAVRELTEVNPTICWPNDLYVSSRKLGGVLVESRPVESGRRAWAIGIGINCLQQRGHFPAELQERATSLDLETAGPVNRWAVARGLLRSLDRWLAPVPHLSSEGVLEAWLESAESIGRRVRLRSEGRAYEGTTVEIDPLGGLTLQTSDGRRVWFDPMQTTVVRWLDW